eukprot:TRINITY_DN2252_c0_g1_i23.p1 TRINITY_DN2252_c0_g1~~TRINITY_DN2252_c0_g1_i23.p1  ORF type:complete len:637 (+),score=158.65 TRINITY_DN2252_c0_g1_i23:634-2544(+)
MAPPPSTKSPAAAAAAAPTAATPATSQPPVRKSPSSRRQQHTKAQSVSQIQQPRKTSQEGRPKKTAQGGTARRQPRTTGTGRKTGRRYRKPIATVKALYTYTAQSEGELSFEKGDEFVLFDKVEQDGWWKGSINKSRPGHFPSTYVRVVAEGEKAMTRALSMGFIDPPPGVQAGDPTAAAAGAAAASSESVARKSPASQRKKSPSQSPKPARKGKGSSDELMESPLAKKNVERRSVEHYQLGEKLGQGAYGVVYKGLNTLTGEIVAIKCIETLGASKNVLKKLIEIIESENSINLVLEFIEGGSLQGILKKFGKVSESLIQRYILQILRGLVYLHSKGVVHRDLKCANMLQTKSGLVKLADFGIATTNTLNVMKTPDAEGSPYWMAPEVIELKGATTRTDIWSLGCMVIELITGDPPYADKAPMQALFAMVNDPHPPIPCDLTADLTDFLMVCFRKNPANRPSASELMDHPFIAPLSGLDTDQFGSLSKSVGESQAPAPNSKKNGETSEPEKTKPKVEKPKVEKPKVEKPKVEKAKVEKAKKPEPGTDAGDGGGGDEFDYLDDLEDLEDLEELDPSEVAEQEERAFEEACGLAPAAKGTARGGPKKSVFEIFAEVKKGESMEKPTLTNPKFKKSRP